MPDVGKMLLNVYHTKFYLPRCHICFLGFRLKEVIFEYDSFLFMDNTSEVPDRQCLKGHVGAQNAVRKVIITLVSVATSYN